MGGAHANKTSYFSQGQHSGNWGDFAQRPGMRARRAHLPFFDISLLPHCCIGGQTCCWTTRLCAKTRPSPSILTAGATVRFVLSCMARGVTGIPADIGQHRSDAVLPPRCREAPVEHYPLRHTVHYAIGKSSRKCIGRFPCGQWSNVWRLGPDGEGQRCGVQWHLHGTCLCLTPPLASFRSQAPLQETDNTAPISRTRWSVSCKGAWDRKLMSGGVKGKSCGGAAAHHIPDPGLL